MTGRHQSSALLALLASVALAVGLCADEAEDRAVAFFQRFDGTIGRDDKAPGKPVVLLNLGGTKVNDAGQKELASLKNLHTDNVQDGTCLAAQRCTASAAWVVAGSWLLLLDTLPKLVGQLAQLTRHLT